jgi:hypothetical protein
MIVELSDNELELELTIAAAGPRQRAERLDALVLERTQRQTLGEPQQIDQITQLAANANSRQTSAAPSGGPRGPGRPYGLRWTDAPSSPVL